MKLIMINVCLFTWLFQLCLCLRESSEVTEQRPTEYYRNNEAADNKEEGNRVIHDVCNN